MALSFPSFSRSFIYCPKFSCNITFLLKPTYQVPWNAKKSLKISLSAYQHLGIRHRFSTQSSYVHHSRPSIKIRSYVKFPSAGKRASKNNDHQLEPYDREFDVASIVLTLRSMMVRDRVVPKAESAEATKAFKNLSPEIAAEIVVELASNPNPNRVNIPEVVDLKRNFPKSSMGNAVEEFIARLVEISVAEKNFPIFFAYIAHQWPDCRRNGWDNIIYRLLSNKSYDQGFFINLVNGLPKNPIPELSVSFKPQDHLQLYHEEWKKDPNYKILQPYSKFGPLWSTGDVFALIQQFAKFKGISAAQSSCLKIYVSSWQDFMLGFSPSQLHEGEALVSSLYSSISLFLKFYDSNNDLGSLSVLHKVELVKPFHEMILKEITSHPELIEDGIFDTTEFLELSAFLFAEVGSREKDMYIRYRVIKELLRACFTTWDHSFTDALSTKISVLNPSFDSMTELSSSLFNRYASFGGYRK